MSVDADRAFALEAEFLSGIERNFENAKGKHFRGSSWRLARFDDAHAMRGHLARAGKPDRDQLSSVPTNRRVELLGFDRFLMLWKKPTGVAIGSVLAPLEDFAKSSDGQNGKPIGAGELSDHVRRLVRDAKVPHIIGICAPTGFTDDARELKLSMSNVTVVLIEPDGYGGWRTTSNSEKNAEKLDEIFDPETAKEKVARVGRIVAEHSADLLTGGLSMSSLADRTGMPEDVLKKGFEALAKNDPELRLTKKDGSLVLYRGAAGASKRKSGMNVFDRIRSLFSGEGEENEKINHLAERRAGLAQRRDRIYEDIGQLEKKEAELFEQGKTATSSVPRRRIAAQLAQLRKDIARQNTTAAMLNQQINIISTDIHNLTLLKQGKEADLPDTEALTEHAVAAEEMLETLQADADMVGGLEAGMEASLTSDEELAIMREFEAASGEKSPASETEGAAKETAQPAKSESAPPMKATPERDPQPRERAEAPPESFNEPDPEEPEKRRDAEAN